MSNPYVVAGYGLIWLSLILYGWTLHRRLATARRTLESISEHTAEPN